MEYRVTGKTQFIQIFYIDIDMSKKDCRKNTQCERKSMKAKFLNEKSNVNAELVDKH